MFLVVGVGIGVVGRGEVWYSTDVGRIGIGVLVVDAMVKCFGRREEGLGRSSQLLLLHSQLLLDSQLLPHLVGRRLGFAA